MEGHESTHFVNVPVCVARERVLPGCWTLRTYFPCVYFYTEGGGSSGRPPLRLTYRGHALLSALLLSVCSWKRGCLVLPRQTLETTPSTFQSQWRAWMFTCFHVSLFARACHSLVWLLVQICNSEHKTFAFFIDIMIFSSLLCKVWKCTKAVSVQETSLLEFQRNQ